MAVPGVNRSTAARARRTNKLPHVTVLPDTGGSEMRRRTVSPQGDERREERMRPSRFLGYDRDSLGMYALSREMFGVAESQFKRAIYLNPYEPNFKQHLAWCLYKQGYCDEAKEWIEKALAQRPDDSDSGFILSKIEERIGDNLRRRATGEAHVENEK